MFIWLTNPTIGQVLVNLNLVTAVTCVQGRNTVCFTGGEEDYIVVTESLEDIYERIQSAEKRYRLANVLHMMILDNPAVFAPVKEGQHENG